MHYYDLNLKLFSAETLAALTALALTNKDNFVEYRGRRTNTPDGNNYLIFGIRDIPEVREFMENCVLETYPVLFMHHPLSHVVRHVDDANKRNCVIIQPLSPVGNYSSTIFWDSYDSIEYSDVADFSDMNAKLVNTQVIHSVENASTSPRINFQFCFSESFDFVKKLALDNGLFRNSAGNQ